jgi:hypothetical protein
LGTKDEFIAADNTSDFFAPAEFFELTQEQRMTRKSYESFNAGLAAGGLDNLLGGRFRQMNVDYERRIVDDQAPGPVVVPLSPLHFAAQIKGNSLAKSQPGRRVGRTVRKDFRLRNERFGIVNTENLKRFEAAQEIVGNEAEVNTALKNFVKRDPSKKETLAVVALWEMES